METISDFFTIYKQAAFEKEITKMIALYDDEVLIFDMWGKGYIHGLKEWTVEISAWLGNLGNEKVKVDFGMIDVQESGDIAFASTIIQFQAISIEGTILRSMKNRMTLGLVKRNGLWKVKHQHTSAPIDADLSAILDI